MSKIIPGESYGRVDGFKVEHKRDKRFGVVLKHKTHDRLVIMWDDQPGVRDEGYDLEEFWIHVG